MLAIPDKRRHTLGGVSRNGGSKQLIRQQYGLDVGADLRDEALDLAFRRFAEKDGPKAQATANRFFDDPHALNGAIALVGKFPASKRPAQLLHQRIVASFHAAKAVVCRICGVGGRRVLVHLGGVR
jgi:hypothetical protein